MARAAIGNITIADDIQHSLQSGALALNGSNPEMAAAAVSSVVEYIDSRLRGMASGYRLPVVNSASGQTPTDPGTFIIHCNVTSIEAKTVKGGTSIVVPLSRLIKDAEDPKLGDSSEVGVFLSLAEVYIELDGATVAQGRGVGQYKSPTELASQFTWNNVLDTETQEVITVPSIGSPVKRAVEGGIAQALGQAIHTYLERVQPPTSDG